MTSPRIDPLAEASRLWVERYGEAPEPMELVTSVMRVQQLLLARVEQILKPLRLSFARYEALVLLTFSKRGSLPMSIMHQRLMVHPTSVTSIVDRLEKDGLVTRAPHPSDRRTTLIVLTEAGAALTRTATVALMDSNFGLPGALTRADMRQIVSGLRTVRALAGDVVDGVDDEGSTTTPSKPSRSRARK